MNPRPVDRKSNALSIAPPRHLGWSGVTVIYGHDTNSMLYGMMSYTMKLTGDDLSHYLNKIESLGLRRTYC